MPANDNANMARLIEDNLGRIRWLANHFCRNRADDVVQEACVTILRSKSPPVTSVAQWIRYHVMAARRTVLGHDQRYSASGLDMDWGAESEPNQEHATELSLLRSRTDGLPERQRDVVLSIMAGNDFVETGRDMGISPQAARKHLLKARETLGLAA